MARFLAGLMVMAVWAGPAAVRGQGGPVAVGMDAVAFMAGCWQGGVGEGGAIMERWGPRVGNVMLGTTLIVRGDSAVFHELAEMLRLADGRIRYTPYPGGTESPDPFFLTDHGVGWATFEAPEHDYPKRIHYRRVTDDGPQASIDGGPEDPEPGVWMMSRVPCGMPPR